MTDSPFTESARYVIQIKGHLGQDWSKWFDDLGLVTDYASDGVPITALSGPIPDQAALHSVLAKIRDLGLELISVERPDRR